MLKKSLNNPDMVRNFDNGKLEIVTMEGVSFGRATYNPGWKWSESLKEVENTESCSFPHTQFVISGKMHIVMDDGKELEVGPGDASFIPPGHDAWVVGNEPVIVIDIMGKSNRQAKAA